MKIYPTILVALLMGFGSLSSSGQEEQPDEAAIRAELDEFRNGLYSLFNEGRYEEMLQKYCHPDVIAMWQDGNISQGHAEVLAEFKRLSEFIERIHVEPTVEKRLILGNGNFVISTGQMKDTYDLKRGETVALNSKWTGTMVKQDGRWVLVSFSGSANAFDNSVIRLYFNEMRNKLMGGAALAGLVVGCLLTWIGSRMLKGGRSTTAAS